MPRIVVAGSINIDLTTYTDEFPRPGETIFGRDFSLGFGGKGANQAVAARSCGADVAMVGRVGDDMFGHAAIENLKALGIDTRHVIVTPGVSTGVAPIFVDSSGQNRILVIKGANDRLSPEDVYTAKDVFLGADMVIFQLEIPLSTTSKALAFAKELGIKAILNPAPAQKLESICADYVIPNETEAELIGVPSQITTLGEKGALLGAEHVPGFVVEPVDTSGAGDAFIGSFAVFLSSGCSEREAVERANLYAALSTLSAGTQKSFVTLERFNGEWQQASQAKRSGPLCG